MASNMGLVHRANSQIRTATVEPEARKASLEAKERKPHANAWSILWRACLPYLLIAVAFGGYVVIAQRMGWWR